MLVKDARVLYVPSMREGLTVKGITERVQPDPAEAPAVHRRLRHDTKLGLLAPLGEKHSGTGRWRTYPEEAVYVAAVLEELAKYGVDLRVRASVAALVWYGLGFDRVGEPFSDSVEVKKGDALPNFQRALDNSTDVYLHIARETGRTGSVGTSLQALPEEDVSSVLTINLTKVFAKL